VVTPIPKIARPTSILHFRPISVTPILFHLAEKMVVRRWLFPAIDPITICDQFVFRPTGSTTCALCYFLHHVTRLLEEHSYVQCLMIDFGKAFDIVRHDVLGVKLAQLKLPSSILQWINSFVNGGTQQVKYASSVSRFKPINMGNWA